jgi:superfamily I DNA and/or RNA helicase
MSLLRLDNLPPRTTRGTIVRLLTVVAELEKEQVGAIELRGRSATVEVPPKRLARVVAALDGVLLDNRHVRASAQGGFPGARDDDHFARMIRLLDMEADEEARQMLNQVRRLTAEEAEKAGNSIVGLTVKDEHAGLGGRALVVLSKPNDRPLPWTRLGIGSPVLLSDERSRDGGWRGVISERDEKTVEVAFDQPPDFDGDQPALRLDLSNDEVARRRQRQAMERAKAATGDRLAQLREILLGNKPPEFDQPEKVAVQPLDPSLNGSQLEAVRLALAARDVGIIHGPPGTGKTTTVVELIRQAVTRSERVLACAPSNLGVDNIFERLLAAGVRAVRLGHPARVLPALRQNTLDLMVEAHPDIRLARRLQREAFALRDKADRYTRAKPAPGAKREMRAEARALMDDARRLEAQVVAQVLDSAAVLCSTTTGLDSEVLGQRTFDLAVIDEACQSTEPGCWIPLLRSHRLVLAGDHCQLPPTVVSVPAKKEGFDVSLQERLIETHGGEISRRLEVQYRMNETIMEFSSQEFYEGSLQADNSVRRHVLADLPSVAASDITTTPVHFFDTAGAGWDEELEPDGESRRNRGEAEFVVQRVQQLLEAGLAPRTIGVITPYAAQVRLLREMVSVEGLEIDSVDGFQGREKEAIVISLVRSNQQGEIGFLADVRRMNVALTRARRKLILIGDSATLGGDEFYVRLLEYLEGIGAYHTVWEFL